MVPPPLVDIATACTTYGRRLSVIGVVVDAMSPAPTRGTSTMVTLELKDDKFDLPAWDGCLKIRYFKDDESTLPHARENDVILFRNIKIGDWHEKPTGTVWASDTVPWMIFRAEDDPSRSPTIIQGPDELEPTDVEKKKAYALLDHVLSNKQATAPQQNQRAGRTGQSSTVVEASLPTSKKPKIRLIKDVESGVFCELVVQVIKKHFWEYDNDKGTLWVTDYTPNESLPIIEKNDNGVGTEGDRYAYISGKTSDWRGPWGKHTLQVTLWEPHATFSREEVKLNDIVHLTYVRPKYSRQNELEATVSTDKKFPDRCHIKVVSADYNILAKKLTTRRKEYWRIHGERKETTKSAKKKKSQESKKAQHAEENQTLIRPPMPSTSSRAKNPKVRTRNLGLPSTSIDDILLAKTHIISLPGNLTYNAPFQNVGYTLTSRVVDFYPPNLEDFAKLVPSNSIVEGNESWDWQWRFCLLVEGVEPLMSKNQRRERLKIFVAGAEADHLLCIDATDLRRDHDRLESLREKLWVLWGNLEEVKQANMNKDQAKEPPKLSSLPFEYCIREYGVPCLHSQNTNAMAVDGELCVEKDCFGWERRFALFGTTIGS